MGTHTTYAARDVVASVDGLQVRGWGNGDNAISLSDSAEGARLVGMDGSSIFSMPNDLSGVITLRLLTTSRAHELLSRKWARQKEGGGFRAFPVSCKDRSTGEGFTAAEAVVMSAPDFTRGQNATIVEWQLSAGEIRRELPRIVA